MRERFPETATPPESFSAEKILAVLREEGNRVPHDGLDKDRVGDWMTVVTQYARMAVPFIEQMGGATDITREIDRLDAYVTTELRLEDHPVGTAWINSAETLRQAVVEALEQLAETERPAA